MSKLVVTNIETQNIKFDSDTTAFTIASDGTVSGTGDNAAMVKLADVTINSVVSDVSTTGLSTVYDTYFVTFHLLPVADGPDLYFRIYSGGSEYTNASAHTYDMRNSNDNSQHRSSGNSYFRANRHAICEQSEAAGGGISGEFTFLNAQSTTATLKITGQSNYHMNGGTARVADFYGGGFNATYPTVTMDGIKFYFSSGNIHSGRYRIYGIK